MSLHPPRRRPWRVPVSWGLLDQGFSSATNFALTVIAARFTGPRGLGVVYIGFSIYLLALSFQRALITDPLVVVSSPLTAMERQGAARASLTLVLGWGLAATALMEAAARVIPGPVGHGLALFAPWMLLALIQDFWRSVLFRDGRGAAASLNDGTWLAVMALMLILTRFTHADWLIVAIWGVGASAGGLLGFLQSGLQPISPLRAWRWWRKDAYRLSGWLGLENTLLMVQSQALVLLLVSVLGARDLGGLRAVESVFAPMTVMGAAIEMAGLPVLSKAFATSFAAARKMAARLSSLTIAAVVVYLLAAGLLRGPVLSEVFGRSFSRFSDLVLPIGVGQLIFAWGSGFWILAKACSQGRWLLLARAVSASSSLLLATVLAVAVGINGAAWGLAIGTGLGSALITYLCTRDRAGRHALSPMPA